MASSLQPQILIFKADAAISKGQPVKIGSDKEHVAKATAASDKMIGICQNDPTTAEDLVEVAVAGGAKALVATGGVSAGDILTADASSNCASTTSNADKYIAQALESGVSGDLIGVIITRGIV